jgi:lysophospholipase L1-like esterase
MLPASHVIALLSAALATLPALPMRARAENAAPVCSAPANLVHFNRALPRVAERIALGGPLTIVALGSSSTAGLGASSTATSYPSRLEVALKAKYPGIQITVLNRGVNGDEIRDMLARLDRSVIAEKPDLVLWQFGTNAVLHDQLTGDAALIADGLERLRATGADVVLIDPQFAPKVIAKPDAAPVVQLIYAAAEQGHVALFDRFAVMRHWHDRRHMAFEEFLDPDSLHMNDWGYDCMATLLADAIAASTRAPHAAPSMAPRG